VSSRIATFCIVVPLADPTSIGHFDVEIDVAWDEGGVTGTASEVDQSTLGEEDDVSAGRHGESVDLGLDVDGLGGSLLEPGNVNLDVKVTDAGRGSIGQPRMRYRSPLLRHVLLFLQPGHGPDRPLDRQQVLPPRL
jgi:hypothetical protein